MRVAYDHQIFSWQKYGGISRYYFELANKLSECPENDISIVSPLYVNEYLRNASPNVHINGIKIPRLRRTGRAINLINKRLEAPILSHLKPNIVHETYYAKNRIAPKFTKVVLTVYDMIHERFAKLFSPLDNTSANKAAAVGRADHVICISESTRQDLIEIFDIDPNKTSVAYLGFSLTQQKPLDFTAIDRPYLLYVGQRWGYKNFQALLHAYATSLQLMSNYDLVVFGGGCWTDSELGLARHLGIDASRLHNIQGNDSILASLYRNASLFIYPSMYEGFGIPPLEAMSFGCPVVSSNTSSLPEVVGDAAELFDPQSSSAMLDAMERVLGNARHRQELVDRGYIRIKKFSWQRCAEQTAEIYRSVM